MEVTMCDEFSVIASCVAVLIMVLAWRLVEWIWLKPKRLEKHLRTLGFHGNPYRPLSGDLKEISAMTKRAGSTPISLSDDVVPRVAPFVLKTVNHYGKKSFIWFGPVPNIHIMEPELVKEVLSKNFIFQKPQSNPLGKLLATGIAAYDVDKWAKHRKIITPAFHMEKLKNMLPAFHESCSEMTSAWENIIVDSKELDVWPYLQTLSADVISRTAFGSSYEEGRKIFQLQTEQLGHFMEALNSVYIPGWRFVPTKRNRRMKKIAKEVNALLMDLIGKRMKAMKAGKGSNDDLLGILLESNFREIEQQHGSSMTMGGMTIKDVIEECKLFYFAGQETTAILLVWTMILLSKHQDWQRKARDEVLQVFGKNGAPDFNGLNHLKVVTMILYEVLRLYPPLVVLTRAIHEETKLGPSITLPAGVLVSLPTVLLHYDQEIWGEDAKEFNPERFAEGISKSRATKSQVSYFPFGWGPRVCIGQNFALLEAKMAMAMILQRFSFELSPSYAHAPIPAVLVQPQFGAHLILHQV